MLIVSTYKREVYMTSLTLVEITVIWPMKRYL